jgi:hypothetical protein
VPRALVLFLVSLAVAAAFFVGRETKNGGPTVTEGRSHIYTARAGDVFRAPEAATECLVSQEGGFPDLFCTRIPRGRHHVVFFEDSFLVYRIGNTTPVFSARWKP